MRPIVVCSLLVLSSLVPAAAQTPTTSANPAVNTSGTVPNAAPVAGANSFTETQARERIGQAGYSDVTALTKGDDGIWRGQATKSGSTVRVTLDFRGNVAAQ